MILLLDIGNTRLKWMWSSDGALQRGGAVVHRDNDLMAALQDAWSDHDPPERIVAASVAGNSVQQTLAAWAHQQWGQVIEFVAPQAQLDGVSSGYARPERLGVDRWLSLLAVHAKYSRATCIVSCGSALTIDAIDRQGQHLGGLIVPGFGTMHRSLTGGDIHLDAGIAMRDAPQDLLGHDTVEAVGYGIHYCLAAYVDWICDRLDARLEEQCLRLLCGGDATRLMPLLQGNYQIEEHLVFEGLMAWLRAGQGVSIP